MQGKRISVPFYNCIVFLIQVVLGLVCPFYITRLEFKSREELQLMPQTQEEHLIALEDEKEDSDSEHGVPTGPDVEVMTSFLFCF